ncbi:hypothetical protein Tco_0038241, partial [Tanacetum coccineum]
MDWGIPELTGDGDGDGESLNYETGDGDNINLRPRRKIPESPWGSPIPIGDGDGDVNRFPDGDGDGDGDEPEKQGWGCANFSLIAGLKANKYANVDTIMNLLRLEDTLAERLCLIESQPHVNQLTVPIHHSPDQHVIGASTLSLSLDVSSSRPLFVVALEGTEGTSGAAPGTTDTTTALYIIVASTSIIRPISIDDYE